MDKFVDKILFQRHFQDVRTTLLCKTRYPVFFVHGAGYRDSFPLVKYWGRIPEKMQKLGILVFTSKIDALGSYETNALGMKNEIDDILAQTQASKVNIIGHSKGGLDARYMIRKLDMGSRVASLTTISTPHRGSALADFVLDHFHSLEGIYGRIINLYARIFGDSRPNIKEVLTGLSRRFMQRFNDDITNHPAVIYQSLTSTLKNGADDPLFLPTYKRLFEKEGPNDGLVSVGSACWGDWKGVVGGGKGGKGISHLEITDFKKRSISGIDIPGIYIDLVRELSGRGF